MAFLSRTRVASGLWVAERLCVLFLLHNITCTNYTLN